MQVRGSKTRFEWQGVRNTASQDWMVTGTKGACRAHAFQEHDGDSMLQLKDRNSGRLKDGWVAAQGKSEQYEP